MSQSLRLPRSAGAVSQSPGSRLHPYAAIAAKYWAFILAAAVIGALVGFGLSQLATPGYSARSTLYFSIGYGNSGSDLNQGGSYAQGQMLSFAELATSERVLQPVIDDLELPLTSAELAGLVDVTTPANTVVLDITATSSDPELAASIANGVAQNLTDAVSDVAPRDEDGRSTVAVRTVQSADTPTVPVSPNTRVNVVAATLIGLIGSVLAIAIIRALDTRVRDESAVGVAGALPVLARLRAEPVGDATPADEAVVAEDYRRLAATLDAVEVVGATRATKRGRVFLVASVLEGSSETAGAIATRAAAGLALAATESGLSVALLRADDQASLTERLDESITVEALPSTGAVRPAIATNHDLVIIAAPEIAVAASSLVLGRASNGVVLLADSRQVHVGELRETVVQLETAGARVVGTAISGIPVQRRGLALRTRVSRDSAISLPVLEHHEA